MPLAIVKRLAFNLWAVENDLLKKQPELVDGALKWHIHRSNSG